MQDRDSVVGSQQHSGGTVLMDYGAVKLISAQSTQHGRTFTDSNYSWPQTTNVSDGLVSPRLDSLRHH